MKGKIILTASAVLLVALGIVLNFMPQEAAAALGIAAAPATTALTQVLASALLGMGFINWFSRANRIGGIYARPLALGNFLLFGSSALSLGRTFSAHHDARIIGAATAVFAVLALAFCWLIFFADPLADQSTPRARD